MRRRCGAVAKRRQFNCEFKVKAVNLVSERGVSVAQAGGDLDIARMLCARSEGIGADPAQALSHAEFCVTRRSGGVVCRHVDDLDALVESDTCNHLRQLICV